MKTKLVKVSPGHYKDPVTGRFEVRRASGGAGGLYDHGPAWRWIDTLDPKVCGLWRATMAEAVADLDAHDSSRSALDILKGWN